MASTELNEALRSFEAILCRDYEGVHASIFLSSGTTLVGEEESADPWQLYLVFDGRSLQLVAQHQDGKKQSELYRASRSTRLKAVKAAPLLVAELQRKASEDAEAISSLDALTRTLAQKRR
ncbi:MAG: hypothetical protein ABW252_13875 [Polyangiales bacterium]